MPAPGNPQSLNRYAYVYNNPLRYTDPSGHDPGPRQGNESPATYILRETRLNTQSAEALAIRSANDRALVLGITTMTAILAAPLTGPPALYCKASAYRLWIAQVNTGKDWDHKSEINLHIDWSEWGPDEGEYVEPWVWSNVHYGFVGYDVGLSSHELLWGAGAAQAYLEIYGKGSTAARIAYVEAILGGQIGAHTLFDNPGDARAIWVGIWMRLVYGRNVTEEQLIDTLRCFGLVRRDDE